MSDAEDLEEIRRRKREKLTAEKASPSEPIDVRGVDHFEELLQKYPIVLVDFYADWCGPCKMLAPTVAAVATETEAVVLKVDIDAHQDLAAEYRVQGVPTLYLFDTGEVEKRMVGVQDKATLLGAIESVA